MATKKKEIQEEVKEIEEIQEVKEVEVEEKATENKKITNKELDKMVQKAGIDLKNSEQINIRIPIDPLNPNNLVVPVALNGYIYQIKRGERVTVPKEIAELLEEANYI